MVSDHTLTYTPHKEIDYIIMYIGVNVIADYVDKHPGRFVQEPFSWGTRPFLDGELSENLRR
jgi:hypothetical protein